MITNKQIDEILAVRKKATPGPWTIKREDIGDEFFCYVPIEIIGSDGFPVVSTEGGLAPCNCSFTDELLEANAELIIATRTLLPALAADYKALLAVVEQRWISVEERLPEELQVVLVSGTGDNPLRKGYECGWLINGDWTCWFTKDITHWMPLPAPPEGGEK